MEFAPRTDEGCGSPSSVDGRSPPNGDCELIPGASGTRGSRPAVACTRNRPMRREGLNIRGQPAHRLQRRALVRPTSLDAKMVTNQLAPALALC